MLELVEEPFDEIAFSVKPMTDGALDPAVALQAFTALTERFRDHADMAVRQNVIDGLYLSACLHAGDGDAAGAADLLRAVADQAGGIEPEIIADDSHFAAIRETEAFRTLLTDLAQAR